jgi:hypothetical protein
MRKLLNDWVLKVTRESYNWRHIAIARVTDSARLNCYNRYSWHKRYAHPKSAENPMNLGLVA